MRAILWASDKGDLPVSMPFTNNLSATTDPGATNDISQGYEAGSQWVNVTGGRAWVCLTNTKNGATWALDGGASSNVGSQVAAVARDTTTTLTGADIVAGIITTNPAGAINLTLPTAANLDTAFGASAPVNTATDFSVINTNATNAATLLTATGWTLVGSMVVALTTSARFRARKTGTGAWTLYRIS